MNTVIGRTIVARHEYILVRTHSDPAAVILMTETKDALGNKFYCEQLSMYDDDQYPRRKALGRIILKLAGFPAEAEVSTCLPEKGESDE